MATKTQILSSKIRAARELLGTVRVSSFHPGAIVDAAESLLTAEDLLADGEIEAAEEALTLAIEQIDSAMGSDDSSQG